MKKGQITIAGSVIVTVGLFIAGAIGTWINRVDSKAEKALGQTSDLKADLSVVKNDVQWIRGLLEKQQKSQATK